MAKYVALTITGTATEEYIQPDGCSLVRIETPGTLTSVTLKLQGSNDNGGTYKPLHKTDGTEWSLTVTTTKSYAIDKTVTTGVKSLKVTTNASDSTRILTLVFERVN